MSFDFSTLITDRTNADLRDLKSLLARAGSLTEEERVEFNLAQHKGAYNYTDLNRVTEAMDYLDGVFKERGYVTGYQRIRLPRPDIETVVTTQKRILPEGFTLLEYIESTGTQYFNTGVIPTKNTRIEVVVSDWASSEYSTALFGARTEVANRYELFISADGIYRSYYGGASKDFSGVSCEGKTTVIRDGVTTSIGGVSVTNTEKDFTLAIPLYLLGYNNSGSAIRKSSAKLWASKLSESGVRLHNYLPARRDSDNKVAIYDLVNNEFCTNAGTGEFIAGPEAEQYETVTETIITPNPLLPNLWYEADVPTVSQMHQYISNVAKLKAIVVDGVPTTVPADMVGLTVAEANAIEQILVTVDDILARMLLTLVPAGTATSGGDYL